MERVDNHSTLNFSAMRSFFSTIVGICPYCTVTGCRIQRLSRDLPPRRDNLCRRRAFALTETNSQRA